MITTFFKLHFSRFRLKVITYRNHRKFQEKNFLNDLKEINIIMNEKGHHKKVPILLKKTYLAIVNKSALLKMRIVRGNQASFIAEKFLKAICNRSRLKDKMDKNSTEKKDNETCLSH